MIQCQPTSKLQPSVHTGTQSIWLCDTTGGSESRSCDGRNRRDTSDRRGPAAYEGGTAPAPPAHRAPGNAGMHSLQGHRTVTGTDHKLVQKSSLRNVKGTRSQITFSYHYTIQLSQKGNQAKAHSPEFRKTRPRGPWIKEEIAMLVGVLKWMVMAYIGTCRIQYSGAWKETGASNDMLGRDTW